MTPARWQQITDVFHAALARPPAERRRFVQEASAGDDALRAEVEAMLDADGSAGTAANVPDIVPSDDRLDLDIGGAIGPYRIAALIGAGGMGRVYRARDSRLDRDVAIKVLPALYAANPDRLRRFEQEARAAGALTHPNVLTLYDVGTAGGLPYLVTELLEGETLRERLRRGPMPAARACEVAAAIARGLAAAHAKGIVHRDLKPENVMVTRDGRIKILDFGIAKLVASDEASSPADEVVQTDPGVIVGSAGYMAPEQIRGSGIDRRADVFALGAILFESLTGRGPFDRESRVDALHASLHDDPFSADVVREWPAPLLRIVQRCLEKDPDARFQSAADLAFALESATGTTSVPGVADGSSARFSLLHVIAAAGLLLLAVAGVLVWQRTPEGPAAAEDLARFALPVPPRMRFVGEPAISPDGTTIVYIATDGNVDAQHLFVRRMNQLTTVALPGTEGARSPFFSPDGQSVVFWTDGRLKRTSLDGTGAPVVICAVDVFNGGMWTADGKIVFGSLNRGLQQVDAGGGTPQPLTTVEAARSEIDHHAPAPLPGGHAMLVTVHHGERRFRVDVRLSATGARRTVIEDGFDAHYLPTGHLVYGARRTLFVAPFDVERLEVSGPAVQLLDGVGTRVSEGDAQFALSDSGTLVFMPDGPPVRRAIAWVDRSGNATPLALEPRAFWTPRLSPDGRQFAVVVQEDDDLQIWIHRFDTGTFNRLTSDGSNWAPVWSRDGSHLLYQSERNGRSNIVRQPFDGSTGPEVLATSDDEIVPGGVSVDARTLIYASRKPNGQGELRTLDLASQRGEALPGRPGRVGMPTVSPDGRWLGFTGWSPVRPSLFIRPMSESGPARLLVEAAGYTVWSHAGDKVYFRTRRGAVDGATDAIFELPFDSSRGVAAGPEKELFRKAFADWLGVPGFDVSADGRFLLVLSDPRESSPRELNVLLHVDDEVRRRVREP